MSTPSSRIDSSTSSERSIVPPGVSSLTAKRLAMAVTSEGTVTTEFQRAFAEDEYAELVAGLPE